MMELLEFRVTHDKPILGIPKHKGCRDRLNGIAQTKIGGRRTLREELLLGDVYSDANEVQRAAAGTANELSACSKPNPLAFGILHPERMVDRVSLRRCQQFRHCGSVSILRINASID